MRRLFRKAKEPWRRRFTTFDASPTRTIPRALGSQHKRAKAQALSSRLEGSDGELDHRKTALDFQGDDEVKTVKTTMTNCSTLDEGAQRDNIYELKVKASDDEGLLGATTFTITVEDHPDYPRPDRVRPEAPSR